MIRVALLIIVLTQFIELSGQNEFDIKEVNATTLHQKCNECLSVISKLPPEVTYGFYQEGRTIFFVMTDKAYFDILFKKPLDGIAVDVVTKSQFPCDGENSFTQSSYSMGQLLEPVYYKDFKKEIITDDAGQVAFKVGVLPEKYVGTEYETNILILKNNYACYYNNFFDIPQARWGLLEMGLYRDTIDDNSVTESQFNQDVYEVLSKRMKFVVPFEKGKSEYSQEDIKPIYDSLRLTDYNIAKIRIKAYSSVEGSLEGNIKLQNKRAKSIVGALQAFQKEEIKMEITASENWVEFLLDAKDAGYTNVADLTKQEIKQELNSRGLAKKMEAILKNHRKAIIVLDLEKKTRYSNESNATIQAYFKEAIESKSINKAIELQKEIFSRIKNHKMPSEVVNEMVVPKELEYGNLLKNEAAFQYEQNENDIYAALRAHKELETLMPDDQQVKYNICVLQLKSWVFGELLIDPEILLKDIKALTPKEINNKMVKRLLLNYHIINSEYMMFKREYRAKDISLSYINKNYRYLKMSNEDYLQLAKYFASYARYDWAEKVLKPHMRNIDLDEELLFYYLNLTIVDPSNTKSTVYRTIMLNAINQNKNRFCKLFDPFGQGGINFQLLNDKYLKSTYCENCN
jgi:outer membrane protein OmpA-like peptidoglycan-associated protein